MCALDLGTLDEPRILRDENFINGRFDTTFLADPEARLSSMIARYEKLAAVVAAVEKTKKPRV